MIKVAWLTPYTTDKLWDPALRLRRWNVHNDFLRMGIDSEFFWGVHDTMALLPRLLSKDVIVITEQSESEYMLMKALRAAGKVLVRDHCELMFGFPWQKETFSLANMVVCSSEVVRQSTIQNRYAPEVSTCTITDMWEESRVQHVRETSSGLVAVFMGTGLPVQMLLGAHGDAVRKAGYTLKMITSESGVGIKWSADTWRQDFAGADVALCPQDPSSFPGKSAVKVNQALAYGYPVIASPIQSYSLALGNGTIGMLATSPEEWYTALCSLKDPYKRLGYHARAVGSAELYSPASISRKWYEVLASAVLARNSSLESV